MFAIVSVLVYYCRLVIDYLTFSECTAVYSVLVQEVNKKLKQREENFLQRQLANIKYSNLKNVINLWPKLYRLEKKFLSEIYMIMAIRPEEKDMNKDIFIIIKKDGTVYDYGFNKNICGLKESGSVQSDFNLEIIKNLWGKNIKTFIQSDTDGLFALTNEGKVYSWGDNKHCTLGHKRCGIFFRPTLVTNLSNEQVVDIVCSKYHALALTVNGKVYTWGTYALNWTDIYSPFCEKQSPKLLKFELENKQIVSIACGQSYSMVVTNKGEVYSWGSLEFCSTQQYCHVNKIILSARIVKVACGSSHALALTDQGSLYVWGKNYYGQLGTGNREHIRDPILLNTSKMGKLSDIAALSMKDISVAVNKDGCFYIWGLYTNCNFLTPCATFHTNMYDVFASQNIMYKPLILVADDCEESNIMKCLKDVFDDSSTSDFTVQVEGRYIHVHKTILKISSLYFKMMFQHDCKENNDNVLKIHTFSYNVYKAYLKYLYTDIIDISPIEDCFDLLKLADMNGETNLKTNCIPIIQRGLTSSNVTFFLGKAIEYNEKILEEFCFSFALRNMTEVIQSENFIELDENIKNKFLIEAAKVGVFKT